MNDKPLINRVAQSGIITLNLEDYYPEGEIAEFDIKNYLFRGLILKEKDFREALEQHDWTQYQDKNLLVFCSADAIVPMWAYQLVVIYAQPIAKRVVYGNKDQFLALHYYEYLSKIDIQQYQDQRIVIKGCSDKPVPPAAYMELANRLRPVAKSIMYGEPCSTVPLFKK